MKEGLSNFVKDRRNQAIVGLFAISSLAAACAGGITAAPDMTCKADTLRDPADMSQEGIHPILGTVTPVPAIRGEMNGIVYVFNTYVNDGHGNKDARVKIEISNVKTSDDLQLAVASRTPISVIVHPEDIHRTDNGCIAEVSSVDVRESMAGHS